MIRAFWQFEADYVLKKINSYIGQKAVSTSLITNDMACLKSWWQKAINTEVHAFWPPALSAKTISRLFVGKITIRRIKLWCLTFSYRCTLTQMSQTLTRSLCASLTRLIYSFSIAGSSWYKLLIHLDFMKSGTSISLSVVMHVKHPSLVAHGNFLAGPLHGYL